MICWTPWEPWGNKKSETFSEAFHAIARSRATASLSESGTFQVNGETQTQAVGSWPRVAKKKTDDF